MGIQKCSGEPQAGSLNPRRNPGWIQSSRKKIRYFQQANQPKYASIILAGGVFATALNVAIRDRERATQLHRDFAADLAPGREVACDR
jgi:hypothetical protein